MAEQKEKAGKKGNPKIPRANIMAVALQQILYNLPKDNGAKKQSTK